MLNAFNFKLEFLKPLLLPLQKKNLFFIRTNPKLRFLYFLFEIITITIIMAINEFNEDLKISFTARINFKMTGKKFNELFFFLFYFLNKNYQNCREALFKNFKFFLTNYLISYS